MAAVKPQFRIMKNGYDRFAVDDAIERYQSEIENLEKKLELYSRQVETATDQLNMIKTLTEEQKRALYDEMIEGTKAYLGDYK